MSTAGQGLSNSRVQEVYTSLGRLSIREQSAVMNRLLMSSALGGVDVGTTDRETLADVLEAIARRIEGEDSRQS
jgi:hypothetical protein